MRSQATRTVPLALALLAALAGCRSTEPSEPPPRPEFECTCGDAETDFHGCLHPLCARGETNPDNPECTCGPLRIEGDGQ